MTSLSKTSTRRSRSSSMRTGEQRVSSCIREAGTHPPIASSDQRVRAAMTLATVDVSVAASIGFFTYASNPAASARARSSSPRYAVAAIAGVWRCASCVAAADLGDERVAIDLGHGDVGDDDVDRQRSKRLERFRAIRTRSRSRRTGQPGRAGDRRPRPRRDRTHGRDHLVEPQLQLELVGDRDAVRVLFGDRRLEPAARAQRPHAGGRRRCPAPSAGTRPVHGRCCSWSRARAAGMAGDRSIAHRVEQRAGRRRPPRGGCGS